MGLLDRARRQVLRWQGGDAWADAGPTDVPALAGRLRSTPVLVLPKGVPPSRVEEQVRLWSPDVMPATEDSLRFDLYTLRGPIEYDECLWAHACLPSEYPQCYLLGFAGDQPSTGSEQLDRVGYDLLLGVARRLLGRCRRRADDGAWTDPHGEPTDPWVFAPRALPAEEALDALSPYLTDPHITARDTMTGEYRLDSDEALIWCDPLAPTMYPLVAATAWFETASSIVEYQLVSAPVPEGPARTAAAAAALAEATGGVILDEDGFPWAVEATGHLGATR